MPFFKVLSTLLILITIIAGGFFWAKNGRTTDREKGSPQYKEFKVERGNFRIDVEASGLVKPVNRIEIKSKASGEIVDLPIEEGQVVRQGDLIARLDQKDEQSSVALAEADLIIAKAELQQAELMFKRRNTLFKKKIISEEERDQTSLQRAVAKGKVIQATTTLDRAKDRLKDATVRAPIDGVILQKYVEKGQIISSGVSNVSGGTPIVDLAAMQTVYIEAGIDEIDIGKIEVGQSANVVADAYPDLIFEGKVIRILPEAKVEQNVTLFDVIIEVENTAGKLKSGMNTHIKITTTHKTDILLAPIVALQSEPTEQSKASQRTVLLKEGAAFTPKQITIGLSDFKQAEVLSGLKAGDLLGVEMISRLKKDNDRLEKRIKKSRSFGAASKKD